VSARILIAEDDVSILEILRDGFLDEGFEISKAEDGEQALDTARAGRYDLVVLDWMLPGLAGIEVCRTLRAESDIPIIMLTARGRELDRVLGLELGADDYVTKPFSMAELMSRVRALLRRRELDRAPTASSVRELGGLSLDFARHELASMVVLCL